MLSAKILKNPLLEKHWVRISSIDFEVKGQSEHSKILSPQYLENYLLDRYQIPYTGSTSVLEKVTPTDVKG